MSNNCQSDKFSGGLNVSLWGTINVINNEQFRAIFEVSPYNKRIYITDYSFKQDNGPGQMVAELDSLAKRNKLSKIWVKAQENDITSFTANGFCPEATVYNYFAPGNHAIICSRFFLNRQISKTYQENLQILTYVQSRAAEHKSAVQNCADNYIFKLADAEDMNNLAGLYREVYATYPYPVYSPDYLRSSLDHVLYALAYKDNYIVAGASAELNLAKRNAEMTDFATLNSKRGQGLAAQLLDMLEQELITRKFHATYTIARSQSPGMNLVFARAGYTYTGTLINNCNIAGGLEDMNVWCKSLTDI